MRAAELMEDWPRVEASEPALRAAEIIGVEGLPAVVVVDQGRPRAVLGSAEVLALLVPRYVQEDPSLAGVSDDDRSWTGSEARPWPRYCPRRATAPYRACGPGPALPNAPR